MHRQFLAGMADGRPSMAGVVAAALEGDAIAAGAIADYCEEEQVQMETVVLKVGNLVMVQTVTFILLGRITEVTYSEVVLEDASIVYDTGRFGLFLANGSMEAGEPCIDPVTIGRASIVFGTLWRHALPRNPTPKPNG